VEDQSRSGSGEMTDFPPVIFGSLRVKNESRWIERVIRSILPLCHQVYVLDDHSTDGTAEICESMGTKVKVYRSSFEGLDETRDRQFLLDRILEAVPCEVIDWLSGVESSPYWVLAIDGDEELISGGQHVIRAFVQNSRNVAAKLRIMYLWNNSNQIRVDGVYAHFARPSLFRLMNRTFKFQKTPWGGNFHCSSIPQELLHRAQQPCVGAELLHYGYMLREDRITKWNFYNRHDPQNKSEGFDRRFPERRSYPHIVQGDVPEVPADVALMHAGPLRIEPL
jgi:O-antigen biosynthesis protein